MLAAGAVAPPVLAGLLFVGATGAVAALAGQSDSRLDTPSRLNVTDGSGTWAKLPPAGK